jgi:hypothetical protein
MAFSRIASNQPANGVETLLSGLSFGAPEK